jgi:calcium-dependent protein kinase
MKHPWLQGNASDRSKGKQIDVSVVARIQRFAQNNRFKRSVLRLIAEELLSRPGGAQTALAAEAVAAASGDSEQPRFDPDTGNPIIQDPHSKAMQDIFRKLELTGDAVDRESAALALSKLGYRLEPSEISRLLEQVDTSNSGKVRRGALAASQIDWRHLQQNHMDTWLDIARRAFAALDLNSDGLLHVDDIMGSLKAKLPQDELRLIIQQAMHEAGHEGECCWRGWGCWDAAAACSSSRRVCFVGAAHAAPPRSRFEC